MTGSEIGQGSRSWGSCRYNQWNTSLNIHQKPSSLVEKGCVPFEGTHVILEEVDRMEATKKCQIYDPRLL